MPITSIADLGTALAAKDDMYICAAKKYYYFFTNHDVTIDDPTKVTRTAKDQEYYNQVVQLGRSLRTHQSLRQLIRDIISLPNFKTTGQEIE